MGKRLALLVALLAAAVRSEVVCAAFVRRCGLARRYRCAAACSHYPAARGRAQAEPAAGALRKPLRRPLARRSAVRTRSGGRARRVRSLHAGTDAPAAQAYAYDATSAASALRSVLRLCSSSLGTVRPRLPGRACLPSALRTQPH